MDDNPTPTLPMYREGDQTNGSEPKATFDFSRVGYGWSKQFMRVDARMAHLMTLLDAPEAEDISDFDQKRLLVARAEAVGEIPDLVDDRDRLVAQVLVDVPRAWLMPNAPDVLDWSALESLEYLRDINDLMDALREAQQERQKKRLTP